MPPDRTFDSSVVCLVSLSAASENTARRSYVKHIAMRCEVEKKRA